MTAGNIKVAIHDIGMLSGITEKAILNHLLFGMHDVGGGYLVPMQMETGVVRFVTRDFATPALMDFYVGYPRPIPMDRFDYQSFITLYENCRVPNLGKPSGKRPSKQETSR